MAARKVYVPFWLDKFGDAKILSGSKMILLETKFFSEFIAQ